MVENSVLLIKKKVRLDIQKSSKQINSLDNELQTITVSPFNYLLQTVYVGR